MRPLDGLLVVSIEQAVAAPLCTARLVDAGARVIKIERDVGDFARGYDTAAKGDSSYFLWTNQGKESVVLDFKDPEDHALILSMIAKADVFVQNLAPGALARAGLDSETLRLRNKRLITCDISGYGDSLEMQGMKAYDLLVQGETGLVSVSGGPNELGRIGVSVCDIGAGMTAHAGILEALIKRGVTGKGSGVKLSLFDVAAEWMTVPLIHAEYGAGAPTRQGLQHPSIAPYGAYETLEKAKTIISIQNEREWQRFCEVVLKTPSLGSDPQFSNNTKRVENRGVLDQEINQVLSAMTAAELRNLLTEASIAFGALNTVEDLMAHKALRRRHVPNSMGETVSIPAPPIQFARESEEANAMAVPTLGNSTAAIRKEFSKN
ncbi:CaiB/BaiF CoA transferase family protein [Pseudohalocynthiibacter aestuariivivens]|uniref:CaiB/BaiF CoA transferase family protein n=1 Tax=Pseudohalocynthiibacter aestuariivivens TaxID=1591409 RepID=A0ABV5JIF8_9RHOB|nr:CaiB/BaiF CoA-transferase family protein [Pseudohalocynthiibacter aestuariivivens]MBS9716482.1 CoA transferase [Pseudohalocynthiibacter aestuariivivens]